MKEIQGSCSKAKEKPEHVKLKKYRYEEKDLESQNGLGSTIGRPTKLIDFFLRLRAQVKKTDTHGCLMGQNEYEIGDAC